jgi:hypothetical protein
MDNHSNFNARGWRLPKIILGGCEKVNGWGDEDDYFLEIIKFLYQTTHAVCNKYYRSEIIEEQSNL